MQVNILIVQLAFLHTLKGSAEDTGFNITRSILDPCRVLCKANGGSGCAVSKTISGQCEGLYRDESGAIVHGREPKPEWTGISAEEARSILSTQTESCADVCSQVDECTASYCKQNNHCHGLFWSDVTKREACFHTDEKPCKTKIPVLCVHESTTTTTASSTVTEEELNTEMTPDVESIDSELLDSSESVGAPADIEDGDANPLIKDGTSADQDSGSKVSHRSRPEGSLESRGLSIATNSSPVKANQNDTQPSKSFGLLRSSSVAISTLIITSMFMQL